MTENLCSPILKWVGGKRQLLGILRHCVSEYSEETKMDKFLYHEPFFGGGALFYDLVSRQKLRKAYLNDINRELIQMYDLVKSKNISDKLLEKVVSLEDLFNKSKKREVLYSQWKERFNELLFKLNKTQKLSEKEKIEASALLISLNKTCFNGVYRKNKKGKFNVPFGKKTTGFVSFLDTENFKNVSNALQKTTLTNYSFEKAINFRTIKPNHLIFLDPPYIPISKTAQFKGYYDDGFSVQQHLLLAEKMNEIDSRGAYFILTNSNTELVKDIYLTKNKYSLSKVSVSRSINQKGKDDSESGIKELLITNFKFQVPTQMKLGI